VLVACRIVSLLFGSSLSFSGAVDVDIVGLKLSLSFFLPQTQPSPALFGCALYVLQRTCLPHRSFLPPPPSSRLPSPTLTYLTLPYPTLPTYLPYLFSLLPHLCSSFPTNFIILCKVKISLALQPLDFIFSTSQPSPSTST
jgi:hypothetical protein